MAEPRRNRNPNWADLPDELTAEILSRMGPLKYLQSAELVCKKWHEVSKDPLFWSKIHMHMDGAEDFEDWEYEDIFRHVVGRSSGEVVDISITHFATNALLRSIAKSNAKKIRRIRLLSCNDISDEGLSEMVSELRLLEEVDISLCRYISHEGVRAVGRSCPLLKSFKFNKEWCRFSDDESTTSGEESEPDDQDDDDDDFGPLDAYGFDGGYPFAHGPAFHAPVARALARKDENSAAIAIAGTMKGLRHLQLSGNKLTDDGLRKILDSCPHLESLDLRLCFNLNMGIDVETRFVERIKRFWRPHDSIDGKGFTSRSDGFCFKWVELPDDVTMSILSRLGTVDILDNAQKVCMKWHKICKEMKWTSINMRNDFAPDITFDYDKMCHHVVDLSCGNLVDVNMEDLISDGLLDYIAESSRRIRRLRIACSYNISDEGLIEVASKLPILEELDISVCEHLSHKPVKVLGQSCPILKSFKLNKKWHKYSDDFFEGIIDDDGPRSKDDDALAIAGTMHGLHHLQLFGNQLTNVGLMAILDGCPHLESLDLRYCFNLNLEGDLGKRCSEQIRKLLLPTDSIADYGLIPSTDWEPPRKPCPPSPKDCEFWNWSPYSS